MNKISLGNVQKYCKNWLKKMTLIKGKVIRRVLVRKEMVMVREIIGEWEAKWS